MSIIFLTADDFLVQEIGRSKLLMTNIKGISVVMFYSTQCKHCHTLLPIFKSLPRMIPNCQFAAANIDLHPRIIAMSRTTIDPISHVPYLVFYANRRPIIKYSGRSDINSIAKFISDVSKSLASQNFFTQTSSAHGQKQVEERAIPAYTTGFPCSSASHKGDETRICHDDVCYLTDADAYSKN